MTHKDIVNLSPAVFWRGLVVAAALVAAPVAATTVIGSSGYGVSTGLSLLTVIKGSLPPVGLAAGVTAPGYNVPITVASVSDTISFGLLSLANVNQTLKTGIITNSALGSLPTPLTGTGAGNSLVNGLNFSLSAKAVGALVSLNLLTIKSTAVTSTSSVSDVGGLTATGTSSLAGLTISGLGLNGLVIDGSLFVNPAANTVLLDVLGIKIVLNEQITSGNGLSSKGITTNALHVILSNYGVLGGVLNGDLIIAHSRAYIIDSMDSAVPEPAIWLQMIVGFGLAGCVLRRRQFAAA